MHPSKNSDRSTATDFKCLKFEERLLNAALNSVRCDDIKLAMIDLDSSRCAELCLLNEKRHAIDTSIDRLKRDVSTPDGIQKIDVESCEKFVQGLCLQISDFKRYIDNRVISERKNESILTEEVVLATKLCSPYDGNNLYKPAKTISSNGVDARSSCSSIKNMDVENFKEFLHKNGGHTGGWGDEEHKIFLKYQNKFGQNIENNQEFINNVQCLLPDKTEKEITLHAEWMTRYVNLKELQSDAISNWKLMREADRQHIKILEDNALKMILNNTKTSESTKSKIKEWHTKKELDKSKNDSEKKSSKTEETRRVNRQKEKEIVAQWIKEQKTAEESKLLQLEEQALKERKERSTRALEKIREYRKRDQTITAKRLLQIQQFNQSRNFITNVIPRKDINERHFDLPNRNYAAFTEQWSRRIMKDGGKVMDQGTQVENIPKLKVPQWRQGLIFR